VLDKTIRKFNPKNERKPLQTDRRTDSMEFKIRSFEESDIDFLVEILTLNNQYNYPVIEGPHAMKRVASCETAVFLVAETENPCGFIKAIYDGSRALIHLLSVHPHCQRQGIGTALVNAACKELSHRGAPSVSATVTEQSVRFWEKQGFKRMPVFLVLKWTEPTKNIH